MSSNSILNQSGRVLKLHYKIHKDAIEGMKHTVSGGVKMSDVRDLRAEANKLMERLQYVGALAFIYLNHNTGTHARIVDYDAQNELVYFVHEDCHYNNDCPMEELQKQEVETVELHTDPAVPGGEVYYFWIKNYVVPKD